LTIGKVQYELAACYVLLIIQLPLAIS